MTTGETRSPGDPGGGIDPFDATREVHDTPAEVDAAFRTIRRVALTYFGVFLLLIAVFPVLTMTIGWWTESRAVGGLSPAFVFAAGGLYVLFVALGVTAAARSSAVESRMLGGTAHGPDGFAPLPRTEDRRARPKGNER